MLSSVPCSRRAWCRDKATFFHLSRPCASHWLRLFQVRRFTGQPVLHLHRWNENQQGPILRGGHGCCCQHDAGVQMRRALELASSASAYNSVDRTHRLPCIFPGLLRQELVARGVTLPNCALLSLDRYCQYCAGPGPCVATEVSEGARFEARQRCVLLHYTERRRLELLRVRLRSTNDLRVIQHSTATPFVAQEAVGKSASTHAPACLALHKTHAAVSCKRCSARNFCYPALWRRAEVGTSMPFRKVSGRLV